jgi:hypothetical protein
MELLGDVGHVESFFYPFRDMLVSVPVRSMVCVKHTISSEIVLDTPNGIARRRGSCEI